MEDEGVPWPGIGHQALHLAQHVGPGGPGILAGLVVCQQDDVLHGISAQPGPLLCCPASNSALLGGDETLHHVLLLVGEDW